MKQMYYHNNEPYVLKRTIPLHNFTHNGVVKMELVKAWRDWLDCNHVLRNQTHFLFVEIVEEPEIIED